MCYGVNASVFTFFCLLVFWLWYVSKYSHCCVCVKVFFYCVLVFWLPYVSRCSCYCVCSSVHITVCLSVLVTVCVQVLTLLCMCQGVFLQCVSNGLCYCVLVSALHASVVHASGSGQLQANPHVAGLWLSPGKPTRRAVITMGSNDLVVAEVHMLGPSCQRYNWHTGRCGSIAVGSSPRRGKTLISNPCCLAEVSTRGKDFRR